MIQNLKVGKGRYIANLVRGQQSCDCERVQASSALSKFGDVEPNTIFLPLGWEWSTILSVCKPRLKAIELYTVISLILFRDSDLNTKKRHTMRVEPQLTTFEWGGVKRKREHASIHFTTNTVQSAIVSCGCRSIRTVNARGFNIGVESFRDAEHDDLPESSHENERPCRDIFYFTA